MKINSDIFKKIKEGELSSAHSPVVFWVLILILLLVAGGSVKILADPGDLESRISTPAPTQVREPRFYTVNYKSGVFSPTNLRIHAGDTVRFKNDSFFGIRIVTDPHSAHNQLPGFDSVGDIPQGSYFSYTFAEKGIFGYHNEKNIEEQGTIIVR